MVFFVMGFRPPYFLRGETFGEVFLEEKTTYFEIRVPGFLENAVGVKTAGLREVLIEDKDGNLVKKIIPKKRDTVISYIIKSGDNASKIAHKFGLKVSTILWANNLTIKQTLQVGQKLKIPPTDGVYYTVKKGETLGEIAKIHDIELLKINAYNRIKNNIIKVDQIIFLPEAKRIFVKKQTATMDSLGKERTSIESIGFRLRRPTQGILTQGYHRQHYAIDIANRLNTPIYASADGEVKKASLGWNWGYGKYIIIDHGNGVETLYAHNNRIKVTVGEKVRKGQLVALMGNTGNVRGITGIHLHFEVRIRGRKVNPGNYF
ncbi:peptidoglycan DD-metalloendopeptidase family protein [Candidatus Gracilibacteria bacterium]|nr:peptidoglycan DD-metalloendopeptidase family protein [Candidatus Gracilibacteria bacterium]